MSTHRNHSAKHALPSNPAYIDFPRSDGDSTLWPTNTSRIIDNEGCVNFMDPVPLDAPLSVKWRMGAGDAICVALKLPGSQPYVLRDFPDGYRMFDHNKGKAANPRHDVYLFGSESKARFRSVPEFIPHAIWLMGDGSDVCKCKYCSKKPQREITSSMGNLLRHSNSPSPSRPARPKTDKPERKKDVLSKRPLGDRLRDNKTYAAVQKSHSLPKMSPHIQTKHVMLVERNNNLRDACRLPSEGSLPRYFRDNELVWCALENPIMPYPGQPATTQEEESLVIKFWPAIIDEVKLAIARTPIPPDLITADNAATPWVTRQFTTYSVRFLGISQTYLLPDNMIIPYQSHLVPELLLSGMAHRPIDDWDFTTEKLADFNPCPSPPGVPPAYRDALTTFALALQIASTISTFWCVTDEWDAKLPLPPPPTRPVPPPSSLQSAIEAAAINNAYGGSISTGPMQNRAPPPAPARVVTQVRFQGMWWGGERIWADDLVRLKVPRSCLAPAGAQHIFTPSPGGPRATALAQAQGKEPAAYGAISRGVFMKIDTIHILDANSQGKRECRVTGMLYELADIDWEDPNLPRNNVEALATQAPTSISAGISVSAKPLSSVPSGDMSSSYALPPAPTGFKFRPILAPGYEVVLCLSLISGRYYPHLLQHPQLRTQLSDVIPLDGQSMLSSAHLWALEGLFGGYKNCVDPTFYKVNREKMLMDASKEALDALKVHVKERQDEAARLEEAAAQMDTD